LAEVGLLVGEEHVPKAAIAAGLLQQRQRSQRIQSILLAGEQGAKTLVFSGQIGGLLVVGLERLLAGLHFGEQRLLPIDEGLSEIPALTVKEKAVTTIKNGLPLSPSGIFGGVGASVLPPFVRLYGPDGTLLALGQFQEQVNGPWTYKLTKVFNLPATHH